MALIVIAMLGGGASADPLEQRPLKPPFDATSIRLEHGVRPKKKFICPAVPQPVASVDVESKYAPGSGSNVIDPERAAALDKMNARLRRFTGPLIRLANGYLRSRPADPRIARCVSTWLAAWANWRAVELPGDRRGEAVRAQFLAVASLAYLEVENEPTLPDAERQAIKDWLQRLTVRVHNDYSSAGDLPSRRNNHRYWAGWAVMAAAIVLDDKPMFGWAVASAELGIDSVTPDGFLPLELERRQRSLGYQFFATEPLVMLAEGADANGIDLYSRNDSAILRLAERTLSGWTDPSLFAEKTGFAQDRGFIKSGGKVAWAPVLARRYPTLDISAWLAKYREFFSLAAGGNVDLLYSAPLAATPIAAHK